MHALFKGVHMHVGLCLDPSEKLLKELLVLTGATIVGDMADADGLIFGEKVEAFAWFNSLNDEAIIAKAIEFSDERKVYIRKVCLDVYSKYHCLNPYIPCLC